MERKFAIIIIKNKNNEYLQYYDERWNSYLFLNCRIESEFDIEKIKEEIRTKLNIANIDIFYVIDKIHTKFSESDKIYKEYHHYFFTINMNEVNDEILNKEFIINDKKFKWYSYKELKEDKRIQEFNSDIVDFIKEIEEKNK